MKKMNLILYVFLCVFLFQNPAWAKVRSSVELNNEAVLPSNLTVVPMIPVGTVVPWPSGSAPSDPANWLECNGHAVPAGVEYDMLRAFVGSQLLPA